MRAERITAWVVFQTGAAGKKESRNAVCSQPEWDAMELERPGFNTLIRSQIGNEGEAERLARDLQTPPAPPKGADRLLMRAGKLGQV